MSSPIIICGCTKSGTTLLRNLFDGYPGLFVIPFETHFFQQIRYWVIYAFRRTPPARLSMEQRKAELLRWIEFTNSRHNRVADGFVPGRMDPRRAREVLFRTNAPTVRALCDQYIDAIAAALGQRQGQESRNFVEKSVENAEFADDWKRLYPDARFIHILRNPYSNLVAIRRYLSVVAHGSPERFPSLRTALQAMQQSYYFLYRNLRLVPGYYVMRYEDLLANPQSEMEGACRHLGLAFDPCLLAPSLLGEAWGGNSTSGATYDGISATNLSGWQSRISPLEVAVVNKWLAHVVSDFGYERLFRSRTTFLPMRGESPSRYVVNRILLKLPPG